MKPKHGKWYAEDWTGPMILVEWWNGSIQRMPLKDARLNECGKEHGVKRWCLLPDDTANRELDRNDPHTETNTGAQAPSEAR